MKGPEQPAVMASLLLPSADSKTAKAIDAVAVPRAAQDASPATWTLMPVLYIAFNIFSAGTIVFCNKLVLSIYGWRFVYALTLLHTLTSWAGMGLFAALSMYKKKELPRLKLLPLAAAYVGYVVLNNLSLQVNEVSFYQLTKICIAPVVLVMEITLLGKTTTPKIVFSVGIVCTGVGMATIMDKEMKNSLLGMAVGFGAVLVTALYQIWVSSYQKNLQASSMQLLDQYCGIAAGMLTVISLSFEPWGFMTPTNPGTIIGFEYNWLCVACILLSCVLGLCVNLSTFLVIGATSSLTYNIVGHIKTLMILSGGVFYFGDSMPTMKLVGVSVAFSGIVYYSFLTMQLAQNPAESPKRAEEKALLPNGKA